MLNDLLHGRDDDPHDDAADGERVVREPGRHPDPERPGGPGTPAAGGLVPPGPPGPGEAPRPAPRPGPPAPPAPGAHRLADATDPDGSLFGRDGGSPTWPPTFGARNTDQWRSGQLSEPRPPAPPAATAPAPLPPPPAPPAFGAGPGTAQGPAPRETGAGPAGDAVDGGPTTAVPVTTAADPAPLDPDVRDPEPDDPDLRDPDLRHPDLRDPDLRDPDLRDPDLDDPDLRDPGPGDPDVDPVGIGATTDTAVGGEDPPGTVSSPDSQASSTGSSDIDGTDNGRATTASALAPLPPAAPAAARPAGPTAAPSAVDVTEPLVPRDRADALASRWDAVKGSFVDDPRDAVHAADALLGELLEEFDRALQERRAALEHSLDDDGATTEDLRQALRRYRGFFDRIADV